MGKPTNVSRGRVRDLTVGNVVDVRVIGRDHPLRYKTNAHGETFRMVLREIHVLLAPSDHDMDTMQALDPYRLMTNIAYQLVGDVVIDVPPYVSLRHIPGRPGMFPETYAFHSWLVEDVQDIGVL